MNLSPILLKMKNATRILGGLSVLLSLFLATAFLTDLFDPPHYQPQGASAKEANRRGETIKPISMVQVSAETRGKAVFRTNREIEAKVIDEIGRYELRGISGAPGDFKAYLRDTKLQKTLTKQVGDDIGPFKIVDIEKDKVVVERGGERFELVR